MAESGFNFKVRQNGGLMGRFCDCCGCERPNERFGGKGRRARICRDCRSLPQELLQRDLAMCEILGYVEQSNVSQKNIARLKSLASINDATFQSLRALILEIAQLAPRRRRRWKIVATRRRDLLLSAIEAGLVEDFCEPGVFEEPDPSEFTRIKDSDEFDSFDEFDVPADAERSEIELPACEIPF